MEQDPVLRSELRGARREVVSALFRCVRAVGTTFDPLEPETSMARLGPTVGPVFDRASRWSIARLLIRLERVAKTPEFKVYARRVVRHNSEPDADKRAQLVDALLERAHRSRPYFPLSQFQNLCVGVDIPDTPGLQPPVAGDVRRGGRAALIAAFAELRDLRGERRARGVLAAWKELCETQYADRVVGLANLARASAGRPPVAQTTIGKALGYVRDLADPQVTQLVDEDAALFRNAFSHSRYRYVPDQDAVSIWDASKAPRMIPVADICARLEATAEVALSIVPVALQRFVVRRCLVDSGILDVLIDECADLVSGCAERRAAACARLEPIVNQTFSAIERHAA
jgi:hypothetical protein